MQSGDWTPEHSQALREYVARGISFARAAAEINARFGTAYTRNAAIGRGKRMGLVVPRRRQEGPTLARKAAVRKRKAKVSKPATTRERHDIEPRPSEAADSASSSSVASPWLIRQLCWPARSPPRPWR